MFARHKVSKLKSKKHRAMEASFSSQPGKAEGSLLSTKTKGEITMYNTSKSIPDRLVHTYSIVARDPHTGQMGVAVQSHAFSVGSIVPWAEAGVGAVATQAFANINYGPEGLALMRGGLGVT